MLMIALVKVRGVVGAGSHSTRCGQVKRQTGAKYFGAMYATREVDVRVPCCAENCLDEVGDDAALQVWTHNTPQPSHLHLRCIGPDRPPADWHGHMAV